MSDLFGLESDAESTISLSNIGAVHAAPSGMMAVFRMENSAEIVMMPVMTFAVCTFNIDGDDVHTIRPYIMDPISGKMADVDMVDGGDLVCITPPGRDPEEFVNGLLHDFEKKTEGAKSE